MSSLKFVLKVSRLDQCLIVGFSTWLIALLSNGPLWFNEPKIAAGISMFLSCLGASTFHYGRRADVYQRKWYDFVDIRHPLPLMIVGTSAFIISICIAAAWLPTFCVWVAVFNFMVIVLYANFLDQYWPFKNIAIALVCITPIIMGWYAGHRLHPIVPYLMAAMFCTYLAREILKDIQDRHANRGKRFTMVMSLGISACQKIAAALLSGAIVILCVGIFMLSLPHTAISALVYASFCFTILLIASYIRFLFRSGHVAQYYRVIDIGIIALMLSTFGMRIGLH